MKIERGTKIRIFQCKKEKKNMDFQLIVSETVCATSDNFWNAMRIWLNNPHFVNKRISSSKIILLAKLDINNVQSIIEHISNIDDASVLIENDVNGNIRTLNIDEFASLPLNTDIFTETYEAGVFLMVHILFPRDDNMYCETVAFSIIDKGKSSIIFLSKCIDGKKTLAIEWPYKICYDSSQLCNMYLDNSQSGLTHPSIEWCKNKLFPRLIKWMVNTSNKPNENSLIKESMNLISMDQYTRLYNDLKRKYGSKLIERWTECTDPNKFVYEDIAIASYLILLWEKEKKEKNLGENQTFVDLGCGNGLLVYILNNEGYPGIGIDLRKRKIWDLFAETTRLEERTIIPSSSSLFPDVQWLIGNHSDELTPWIPVIAARSSYNCRFFLLPCCAHEFDGRKFQKDSASTSQYSQYLLYVKNICETCGFETQIDRLRIPSTKRICLIGWSRTYPEDKTELQDKLIEGIINARSLKRMNIQNNSEMSEKWSLEFKARDPIEKVRNCTQIDRNIINEIVDLVANYLLQKVRIINTSDDGHKKWNAGGSIEIGEIVKIIPSTSLKQLKNECGGLQTLLRNNSHIFQIVNGLVQFRVPGTVMNTVNKRKRHRKTNLQMKVKPCWFFNNHPNGCLLTDEKCNFKH